MRADLQAANTVVQEMEIDMVKKDSELDAKKQEIENINNIKASLKAKLKDYHGKLETTVARYNEQTQYIEKLEKLPKMGIFEKIGSRQMNGAMEPLEKTQILPLVEVFMNC